MPNYNPDNQLAATIKDLSDRIGAMETHPPNIFQSIVVTSESTSSSTLTDLTTVGPTVTCNIGVSGSALISISAYLGINPFTAGVNAGGYISVSVDGVPPYNYMANIISFTVSPPVSIGVAANNAASVVITGLPQGSHTFQMKYQTINGSTVNFARRFIQIQPL